MPPKYTIEKPRAYKGLEHIRDTAAKQAIEVMRVLSVLDYSLYKRKRKIEKQYIDNQ